MLRVRVTVAVALLALVAACDSTPAAAPPPHHPTPARTTVVPPTTTTAATTAGTATTSSTVAPPPDPLFGVRLYVNPASSAAQQQAQWRSGGRSGDADQIGKIAGQPQGAWLTPDAGRVRQDASALAHAAAAAGRTPLVVVYNLPFRDCATGYSAGGAANAAAYASWLSALAGGLGRSAPVVILEPDAVPGALGTCLSAAQRTERYGLLSDAVTTLATQTGAHVYIDAGNPGWVQDIGALADALRSAGIGHAAGFALNVANFYTTADSIAYGHKISQALGGTHFVIDTSRNGNGPAGDDGTGAPRWCNPPGRALGHAPTATTSDPAVDALLWVKNPGESDGACRPGAPAAGQWWPQYALQLASASP